MSTTVLIDTPGLNGQNGADTEALSLIVDYIRQERLKVVAVIYLHPITERRLTGSAKLNLRLLQAICGDHFLRNLVLATSMWEGIPAQEINDAIQREAELNESPYFWSNMIKKGAECLRWDETGTIPAAKTAKEIIAMYERPTWEAPKLNILLEMEDSCRIDNTTAYRILAEEAARGFEQEQKEILEEQEEETRELQRQKSMLQAVATREQDNVRRARENLERVEGSGHGLMSSLASVFIAPLQRLLDVPDASPERDHIPRERRRQTRERREWEWEYQD